MGKKSKLGHNPSSVSTKELVEMENKTDAGKDVTVVPSETKEYSQNYRSREHVTFCTLLMLCEIVVVILYGVWFDYAYEESTAEGVQRFYNYFRDVNVMIFFGFGFLMTFLRKYGYSAIGYTFLISALVVQWSILLQGFFETIAEKEYEFKEYHIGIFQLVNGLFCAGAVMISFGGIIGKVSPSHLLVMGIAEPMFYWLNIYIIVEKLEALDIGGGMTIHTFGAYFGLTVTWFVTNRTTKEHPDNAPSYTSDIFSLAGTIFLWIMWPSFNAAIARPGHGELRALANTFLSITASVLSSFMVSRIVTPGHKLDAVHIQNSTLAGGVAMGVAADLNITPGGAVACGFVVGVISVLGYRYLTPFMSKKLGIQDICGIHNLHGMPGLCSGIIGVFAALGASYHKAPYEEDGGYEEWMPHGDDQAGYQMAGIVISLALAIAGGILVGAFMMMTWNNKWFMVGKEKQEDKYFDDGTFWHLPHSHTEEKEGAMDLPA